MSQYCEPFTDSAPGLRLGVCVIGVGEREVEAERLRGADDAAANAGDGEELLWRCADSGE